ncbi:MAG TPA: hypothetical protein VFM29_08170 [Vicinamibacteria bacterium]|nr:hypothetical protein [Vicinamibacteria bacterium]
MLLIAPLLLLCLANPATPPEEADAAYAGLVGRYARGDRAAAVGDLGSWKAGNVERVVRRAARTKGFALHAAAMLHLDRDHADRPETPGREQIRVCTTTHAEVVRRYADALALRDDEGRAFARRLFLVMGQRSQWDACLDEAIAWAEDGLRWFPRDANLLLLLGSAHEEAATLASFGTRTWNPTEPPSRRDRALEERAARNASLVLARRALQKAIAEDPGLALASVRLGRVLWRLGDAGARSTLERAVAGAADPDVLYLAHLFLGQVHEDAQGLEAAAAEYERALRVHGHGQSAAVALSQVKRLLGDTAGSRAVLAAGLSHAGRRPTRDPYWDYLAVNALGWRDEVPRLREETLR